MIVEFLDRAVCKRLETLLLSLSRWSLQRKLIDVYPRATTIDERFSISLSFPASLRFNIFQEVARIGSIEALGLIKSTRTNEGRERRLPQNRSKCKMAWVLSICHRQIKIGNIHVTRPSFSLLFLSPLFPRRASLITSTYHSTVDSINCYRQKAAR